MTDFSDRFASVLIRYLLGVMATCALLAAGIIYGLLVLIGKVSL